MLPRMTSRSLLALGLLLAAIAVERFGYFGLSAFLAIDLNDQGASASSIGLTFTLLQVLSFVGIIAGGAVAYKLGPRATAVVGAGIATLGHFALAGGLPTVVAASVIGLGAGVLRPCPVVAAADAFAWEDGDAEPAPHRFTAVVAFAIAMGCAVNIGGFIAPITGAYLRSSMGRVIAESANGAVMIVAAALAGAALFLRSDSRGASSEGAAAGPYRKPPERPAHAQTVRASSIAGFALLMVPTLAYFAAISTRSPSIELLSRQGMLWILALNPAARFVTAIVAFVLLCFAVRERWTTPPLFLYGIGAVVLALGLVPGAAADDSSVGLYAVSTVVMGAGSTFVDAVPMAYAALARRGRAATLVVAGWLVATGSCGRLLGALAALDVMRAPLLALFGLVVLVAGVAFVVLGRRLHYKYFAAPAPAERDGW